MTNKIKNLFIKLHRKYVCFKKRRKLKYKDFSILSNNCWGGFIYQEFDLPYTSPTIGLFIYERDYVKFLSNIKYYFSLPLEFIKVEESKYFDKVTEHGTKEITYPIAKLNDIEIFFMHYHSQKEAIEKWDRRKKRVNFNRLLVKMSERADCDLETVKSFLELPYNNKICFTESEYNLKNCIKIDEFSELNKKGGDETPYTLRKIDIYKILNEMK